MKLTEENADYMDCRPDFDKTPINWDLVPEYMRARLRAKEEAQHGAASPQDEESQGGNTEPRNGMPG